MILHPQSCLTQRICETFIKFNVSQYNENLVSQVFMKFAPVSQNYPPAQINYSEVVYSV